MSQVEEEQDPEERDQFLQQLYKFMEDRGQHDDTPVPRPLLDTSSSLQFLRQEIIKV